MDLIPGQGTKISHALRCGQENIKEKNKFLQRNTRDRQFSRVCCCCSVAQSCPALCNPMPSSSVHGISQARILEWIAISFSRGSSWPKDRTLNSYISCTWQANSFSLAGKLSAYHAPLICWMLEAQRRMKHRPCLMDAQSPTGRTVWQFQYNIPTESLLLECRRGALLCDRAGQAMSPATTTSPLASCKCVPGFDVET